MSTRCTFCHRILTDPASQQAGAGEVCRNKNGMHTISSREPKAWKSRGRKTNVEQDQFSLPFTEGPMPTDLFECEAEDCTYNNEQKCKKAYVSLGSDRTCSDYKRSPEAANSKG